MASNLKLVLICIALVLQYTSAAPTETTSKEDDSFDFGFKAILVRFKFLSTFMDEAMELHEIIVEKGKAVFEKVLDDPKLYVANNETLEESLKQMREFATNVKNNPKKTGSKLIEFLEEFSKTVSKFKTEDGNALEASLNENGFDSLKTEVLEHFKKFIEKFTKEVDTYLGELSEKEKKQETKLIAWIEKLKNEKDIEKQIDMFDEFFTDTEADDNDSSSSESQE